MKKYYNELNKTQMSLIVGSIMGDGSIVKIKGSNAYLSITHCERQREYLEFKKKLFSENGFDVTKTYERFNKKYKVKQYTLYVRYKKNPEVFNKLRHLIYPKGKKKIKRSILNWMDEQGLAIWHMDDGSAAVNVNKKTGKIRWRAIHLATYNLTYDEHIILQKYMKVVWGIDINVYKDRKWFRTNINATNCKIFIPLVKDYMHKSMLYKIDLKYK